MKSISYFNTTNQDLAYVNERIDKNRSQEEIVYDIFKRYKKLTASEAHELFPKNVPLTSVRRAISNLQYDNKLVRLEQTRTGIYGAAEHYYMVAKVEDRQYDMF